jgi:uncharacterized protein with GYD domain
MPKYLFRGSYTDTGAAGLLKEGGSGRNAAAKELIESVGGSIEAYYWTFGGDDFLIIAELPDDPAAAAVSLTAGASGAVSVCTTKLLSASDVDEVVKRSADYRPPGE